MHCTLCWAMSSEEGGTAVPHMQGSPVLGSGKATERKWGAKGAGQAGGSEESLLE